jgi:hypothetical protein
MNERSARHPPDVAHPQRLLITRVPAAWPRVKRVGDAASCTFAFTERYTPVFRKHER